MSTQEPGSLGSRELQGFRAEVFSRTDLPTIPVVLGRILSVVDNERASARDLVEVIEHDQALTSRVLKLANSALFGLSRKVATVPRAVVLVGFGTVRNLALGVKVWDTLTVAGRQRGNVEALWQHSALVAAAAKLIAARVRGVDPDVSFTAGLLHDVGKLLFSLKLGAPYWTLVEEQAGERAPETIEREQFGVDHAQVGGWLSEAWRLPAPIVAAIRDHHDDLQHMREGSDWSSGRVVWMANRLVHGTDFEAGELRPAGADVLAHTAERGFTAETWIELLGPLSAEAASVGELFKQR